MDTHIVFAMRMARHNVYLPDQISEQARDAGLNLSGLLRGAIETELERINAMSTIHAEQHLITVLTDDGNYIDGRITGELIVDDGRDVWYLTDDGRLLHYDHHTQRVSSDLLVDPTFDVNDIADLAIRTALGERLGVAVVVDL